MNLQILGVLVLSISTSYAQNAIDPGSIPPLIDLQPTKIVNMNPSYNVFLPCHATGNPEPAYDWYFNGERLEVSAEGRISKLPDSGTLVIKNGLKRDEGYYQCHAINQYGTAVTVDPFLRIAKLDEFPDKAVKTMAVRLGASIRIPCSAPQNYPEGPVYWSIVSKDRTDEPIDENERIAFDYDGGLNIANVQKSDLLLDINGEPKQYACTVHNGVLSRFASGDKHIINPYGDQPANYDLRFLWHSPSAQSVARGRTIKLLCIVGGHPTPQMQWSRAEGQLPVGRSREDKFGRELIIIDVEASDAGVYECAGVLGDNDVSRTFTVTVEAAPTWVEQPDNVMSSPGEYAEFRCSGHGIPTPDVFWYTNGQLVTAQNIPAGVSLDANVLSIPRVTPNHVMVVQCNISNSYGYIFKNAYLNVQEEPPVLITLPPPMVKTGEGQSIRIVCEAYGAPHPIMTWARGDFELTGGRFGVQRDGALVISRAALPDEGRYACQATNKWGTSQVASTYLVVRRKTELRTVPEDLSVNMGQEARFTCSATTDPEEITNLKIDWKKDGQFINYRRSQRLYKNKIDNSLIVSSAWPLDTGTYTCVASNGLDAVEASASLTVEAVPEKPGISKVECDITRLIATVYWTPKGSNNAPILEYLVEYQIGQNADKWNTFGSTEGLGMSMIGRLTPGAKYKFRVSARNRIGWSLPSGASGTICETRPNIPSHNPYDLRTVNNRRDNMLIMWTPMSPIEHNGPSFRYQLYWRDTTNSNSGWTKPVIITNWKNNTYTVNALGSFIRYELRIEAVNSFGPATGDPTQDFGFSGEEQPTVAPIGVGVEAVEDANTAIITWDPLDVSAAAVRGFFRGYRVEVWAPGNSIEEEQLTKRSVDVLLSAEDYEDLKKNVTEGRVRREAAFSQPTRALLTHLPANRDLVAQVMVLNTAYVGPPSAQVIFRTPQGVPGPVRQFYSQVRTPNMAEVAWTVPDEPGGVITGYHFSVERVEGLDIKGRREIPQVVNAGERTFRVTGLMSDRQYRITVRASTIAGQGAPYFIDVRTTPPSPPGSPTFSITDTGETSLNVTFEPSTSTNPGSAFFAQYRHHGSNEWLASAPETGARTIRVTGLLEGQKYDVRVVAANGYIMQRTPSVTRTVKLEGVAATRVFEGGTWFIGVIFAILFVVGLLVAIVFARKHLKGYAASREERIRMYRSHENVHSSRGQINPHAENVGLMPPAHSKSASMLDKPASSTLGSIPEGATAMSGSHGHMASSQPTYPLHPKPQPAGRRGMSTGSRDSLDTADHPPAYSRPQPPEPRYSSSSRATLDPSLPPYSSRGSGLQGSTASGLQGSTASGLHEDSPAGGRNYPVYGSRGALAPSTPTPAPAAVAPYPIYGSVSSMVRGEEGSGPRGPRYAASSRPDVSDLPVYKPSQTTPTAPRYAGGASLPRYAASEASSQGGYGRGSLSSIPGAGSQDGLQLRDDMSSTDV